MTAPTRLPIVAVVGRPNVGKSSLVNRIIGRREAIVQETPGVTRDRRAFEAEWRGRRFEIVDTGGLETGASGLEERVGDQARLAMDAADVILLVGDTTTGPLQVDLEVAARLRRSDASVLLVVNKVDRPGDEAALADFYSLGLGDPIALSALHGHGSGDLLDRIVSSLPDVEEPSRDEWASLAIVGRPNVGKSSVANALLREERSLVHDAPGTTRDPIDSVLELPDGRRLRIVDTAGMRRRVRIEDPIEYFSWLRTRGTLTRVDAALLVVDASEGVTGHDQRLASEILDAGRACVIALNKWDLITAQDADRDRVEADIGRALRFLPWATIRRTSATTRRGIDRLLPALESAVESHRSRVPTPALNRLLRDAQEARPHPRRGGRSARVLYGVQARTSPPTFVCFATRRLDEAYVRYLERSLRATYPFPGTPVVVQVRVKPKS